MKLSTKSILEEEWLHNARGLTKLMIVLEEDLEITFMEKLYLAQSLN